MSIYKCEIKCNVYVSGTFSSITRLYLSMNVTEFRLFKIYVCMYQTTVLISKTLLLLLYKHIYIYYALNQIDIFTI